MRIGLLILAGLLFVTMPCFAQGAALLLDDFEGLITGGAEGTVDFCAGGGSSVDISASSEIKYSGDCSLKITYDSVSGGYMWVARGFGLDAVNSAWLVKPEAIDWAKYRAISFYVCGSNSKAKIAFDVKDNGNEMWRFMFEDNFGGWQKIACPFKDFFARGDWQPDSADKNANLDFPLKSFQFEPRPEAKGVIYIDKVELVS